MSVPRLGKVKKVLKNKTVQSPGHLFLITSKVYGFLLQLLYLLNLIFKNLLSVVKQLYVTVNLALKP